MKENEDLSNIEENLRLIELLTGEIALMTPPRVHLQNEHRAYAGAWLREHDLYGGSCIAFHPGGDLRKNHVRKRWSSERFIELGQRLACDTGATILLFGGSEEESLNNKIASAIGEDSHVVMTDDLLEAAAVFERCAHAVTNDTGWMHLAAALGVPTTAIFGPTSPTLVRDPFARRTEVQLGLACQPCFYYSPRHVHCRYGDFRCLRDLSAETVFATVLENIRQAPIAPTSAGA